MRVLGYSSARTPTALPWRKTSSRATCTLATRTSASIATSGGWQPCSTVPLQACPHSHTHGDAATALTAAKTAPTPAPLGLTWRSTTTGTCTTPSRTRTRTWTRAACSTWGPMSRHSCVGCWPRRTFLALVTPPTRAPCSLTYSATSWCSCLMLPPTSCAYCHQPWLAAVHVWA